MANKKKKIDINKLKGDDLMIAVMQELGYDEYQIKSKIGEYKDLHGWKAITLKELMEMKPEELKELKSYCWHDGEPRCDCIGIQELKIEKSKYREGAYNVSFSDENGDPDFEVMNIDDEINETGDGTWDYGLFKKVK